MHRLAVLAVVLVGCSGSPTEHGESKPVQPVLMPPSAVVEDCTQGCDTITLNNDGDVSYLTAADTTLKFDLVPNVCVRLNSPPESKSVYLADGSSWRMTGCQVIDNKNVSGKHWGLSAGAPGVPSWLRVETNTFDANAYCSLSCTEVTP